MKTIANFPTKLQSMKIQLEVPAYRDYLTLSSRIRLVNKWEKT